MKSLDRKSAFTLIELLVVIAIIAILAAILFPVFARVKEAGRKTACMSNITQIGKSLKMYLMDNEGHYPLWRARPAPMVELEIHWFAVLVPYSKDDRIFVCPSDPSPRQYRDMNMKLKPLSYGMNYWVYHQGEYTYTQEILDQRFKDNGGLSRCPIVAECTYFHFADNGDRLINAARHSGGLNILFADWHSEYLKKNVVESLPVWYGD